MFSSHVFSLVKKFCNKQFRVYNPIFLSKKKREKERKKREEEERRVRSKKARV